MRVVLVEDHRLLRELLEQELSRTSNPSAKEDCTPEGLVHAVSRCRWRQWWQFLGAAVDALVIPGRQTSGVSSSAFARSPGVS